MAKNYMAYEAAQVIFGNNKEEIKEVGSRFPLFARTVALDNSEYLLDLLKAIPKVSARVIETGLAGLEEDAEETENEEKKTAKKTAEKKAEPEEEDEVEEEEEAEQDYSTMTAKKLYELCCKRGLSSKCKKRDKNSLIAILKEADGAGSEEETEDDWGEEEEEEKNPYAGKSAKELYGMCKKRKISCPTGKKADYYVELLKKDDAKKADSEEEDEDGDEWEIN